MGMRASAELFYGIELVDAEYQPIAPQWWQDAEESEDGLDWEAEYARRRGWLLHGHTHSDVKVRGKEIHVGVDAHDLAPVSRSWVEKTITEEERRTANPAPRVPMLQRGDKLGAEHTAMLAAVGFQGSASEIGEGGRQGYLYTYDSNPEVDDRVLEITTDRSNIIQSIRISGTPTATVTLTPL